MEDEEEKESGRSGVGNEGQKRKEEKRRRCMRKTSLFTVSTNHCRLDSSYDLELCTDRWNSLYRLLHDLPIKCNTS